MFSVTFSSISGNFDSHVFNGRHSIVINNILALKHQFLMHYQKDRVNFISTYRDISQGSSQATDVLMTGTFRENQTLAKVLIVITIEKQILSALRNSFPFSVTLLKRKIWRKNIWIDFDFMPHSHLQVKPV